MGQTPPRTGLEIHAAFNANSDPTGREVTDPQRERVSLKREKFHGAWHDTLVPRS